jgi:UbiD family decarboxylase
MPDLREWLSRVDEVGELKTIHEADPEVEIGTLTEINDSNRGPALLFERIKGYPQGHRLLSSALITSSRLGIALGVEGADTTAKLLQQLEEKPAEWEAASEGCSPKVVQSGPVMENSISGSQVDLLQFPAPLWNEKDGGRYLGTGDIVVTRDPESEVVNVGTYRTMVHDRQRLGLYISPSHHGYRHIQMYHSQGKPCPVAISFGHHPVFLVVGGSALPYGQSEYNYAGAIMGASIDVIEGPLTGLPIPADSELVVEGLIPSEPRMAEGPFGEFTGYYATGRQEAPVIEVEAVYHRSDPVVLGAFNCKPPHDYSFMQSVMKSVLVKNALITAGVPEVKGVWFHEASAVNFLVVVSIKQLYAGHAAQAGVLSAQCQIAATGNGRYVIVVDEDIDPTNLEEVVWAVGTRSNPETDIDVLRRTFSNRLDPIAPRGDGEWSASRAVIDACRPFERIEEFPAVVRATDEAREKVLRKWPEFR